MTVITKITGGTLLSVLLNQGFGQEFFVGADLSYVNEMNDCGGVYYDKGEEKDVYEIFSSYGANLIRYRLWHDPDSLSGYSFFEDVKRGIARAKAQNLDVLVDFHYSDTWADPGRQWRPAAWNEVTSDEVLGDSVYNYTYKILELLFVQGLLPEMVQIGNETNGNILQPITTDDLREKSPNNYPVNWERQVFLLNKGIKAVNDFNASHQSDVKTVLHIAQPENIIWWMDEAQANEILDFDIIGLSYYPKYSDYSIREVGEAIKIFKGRYGKDVLIVEVAYPWKGTYNLLLTHGAFHSPENQFAFLTELTYLVKENGGMGVVYWEPAWIDTDCETLWGSGSSVVWELLFDESNTTHKGMEFYSYDYHVQPQGLAHQQVTFKVDMTGIDTGNGVYVTGDFTGENWELLPMENTSGNFYQYSTSIPGRSIGAYIFYNENSWTNDSREIVPGNCALIGNTYRKYWIEDGQKELYYSWGRCDQIPNELTLDALERNEITVYPIPVKSELVIDAQTIIQDVHILDISGRKLRVQPIDNAWQVQHLEKGTYLLIVTTNNQKFKIKFIKE